jgi:hypothetical protein
LFFFYSDGEEDEDDEGISERSLRRTPSDDGKDKMIAFFYDEKDNLFDIFIASQDSDYCTEDLNLMNETDVW